VSAKPTVSSAAEVRYLCSDEGKANTNTAIIDKQQHMHFFTFKTVLV